MTATLEMNGVSYEHFLNALDTRQSGWVGELRKKSKERFHAMGLPTRRSEAWKYINLEPVLKTPFAVSCPLAASKTIDDFFLIEEAERLVFINGIYSPVFSTAVSPKDGVLVLDFKNALKQHGELLKPYLGRQTDNDENPFAVANDFAFEEGAVVIVPAGRKIEKPVHLLFVNENPEAARLFHPRILIVLGKDAKAEVLLDHVGKGPGDYLMNAVCEVELAEGSRLALVNVERQESKGYQFWATRARLAERAKLEYTVFASGSGVMRDEIIVNLTGPDASVSLAGLSLLAADSQVFFHAAVNHQAGKTESRQSYKNILGGTSQAEYNSLVHVWRGANQTVSTQLDKNLLLSNGARAYSRPQLKIESDDVSANHGAATGQLQENELFYLQSRGLAKQEARFVLIEGFAHEILSHIHSIFLRRQLEGLARFKIEKLMQSGEGTKCS